MDSNGRHQLIQYARYHGLLDYHSTLDEAWLPLSIQARSLSALALDDPDETPALAQLSRPRPAEKLQLSREAARLMKDAAYPPGDSNLWTCDDDLRHRLKHLRLDQPLLRSDHELDVREWLANCRDYDILEGHSADPFTLDEDADQGLQWPSAFLRLPDQRAKQLGNERLSVSRDAVALLAYLAEPTALVKDLGDVGLSDLHYTRRRAIEPFTPPLLPVSDPDPHQSSSPSAEYAEPILDTSPLHHELERLRTTISKRDHHVADGLCVEDHARSPEYHNSASEMPFSELATTDEQVHATPTRTKAWEFKMEVPLTPPAPSLSKTICSSDIVEEIRPLVNAIERKQKHTEDVDEDVEYDALFREFIEPAALEGQHQVENEKLYAADTIQRMRVPELDMSVHLGNQAVAASSEVQHQDLKSTMVAISRMKLHHWPGVGKVELHMPWAPFRSELTEVATTETFEADRSLGRYCDVSDYENALDVENLTWKPEGLRVTADVDNEGELSPAPMSDLQVLATGTSFDTFEGLNARPSDGRAMPIPHKRPQGLEQRTPAPALEDPDAHADSLLAAGDLDRFLNMRGQPTGETRRRSLDLESPQRVNSPPGSGAVPTLAQHDVTTSVSEQPSVLVSDVSFHVAHTDLTRYTVIVTTRMSRRRTLCRHLSTLWPALVLIERGAMLTSFSQKTDGVFDIDEGDINASPQLTIICTTPARINQKPLPGRGKDSTLRGRVRAVAERFERVIVLIGPNEGAEIARFHENEVNDVNELVVFCAALDSCVSVFVVLGDELKLAEWLVGILCTEKATLRESQILKDLTYWEMFLRRLGMNAFAAQVMLQELKAAQGEKVDKASGNEPGGLPAFIAMCDNESFDYVEDIMGGRRALLTCMYRWGATPKQKKAPKGQARRVASRFISASETDYDRKNFTAFSTLEMAHVPQQMMQEEAQATSALSILGHRYTHQSTLRLPNMAPVTTHRLPTIDLAAAPHAYTTILFILPFQDSVSKIEAFEAIKGKTILCVEKLPWLAGTVMAGENPGNVCLVVNDDFSHTQSNYIRRFLPWYKVFKPSFQELEADRFSHVSISNKYLHAFDEAPLLIPGNDVEETPLFNLQANLIPNGLLLSVMCHAPVLNQLWMSYILHSLFGQTDVQSIAAQNDTTFFVEDIEAQLEENVESADIEMLRAQCPECILVTKDSDLPRRFGSLDIGPKELCIRCFRLPNSLVVELHGEVCRCLSTSKEINLRKPSAQINDVIGVLLWANVTTARFQDLAAENAAMKISQLWMTGDLRRLKTLNIPPNYVGNAFLWIPTNATISELILASHWNHNEEALKAFAHICARVRRKQESIDREYVLKRFTLAKSCPDPRQFKPRFSPDENRDLVWENRSGLGRGLTFDDIPGVEKHKIPTCARVIHPSPSNGVAVGQPNDTVLGKGVLEVQLPLWREDMERLESSKTWQEVVSP